MKKAVYIQSIVLVIGAILLVLAFSSCSGKSESIYFDMLAQGTGDNYAKYRIFHTDSLTLYEDGPYGPVSDRLYAQNIKTGEIRDYGNIFIDGFYKHLHLHFAFGENGFVVTRTDAFNDQGWEHLNQYTYYPYSDGKPIPLALESPALE